VKNSESDVKKPQKPRRKLGFWVLVVASLILITSGLIMLFHKKQVQAPANTTSSAPKSTKPTQDEIDNYKVPADYPRFIYIPEINVSKTRVKPLGVNKEGEVAVPDNIFDAGWYTGSVKPGQTGAMFIFGHISSWEANGIFHDLHKLKAGDKVMIERGDGKNYTYLVNHSKLYNASKVNMTEVLKPTKPGTAALNLMTCAGKVKPGTNEFTERLVVFTTLQT
jgi:sortase (surface protein transpeptidase)